MSMPLLPSSQLQTATRDTPIFSASWLWVSPAFRLAERMSSGISIGHLRDCFSDRLRDRPAKLDRDTVRDHLFLAALGE